MVREWREMANLDLDVGFFGNAYIIFWAVLVTFSVVTAIIFSCADGASKEKSSAAEPGPYGAGCGAECGAACGA
ncbi:hypothetical protein L6164_008045 [Bauhinia variegata]|uniref:Uncharacterized protein n=1 Tax=Bauhinia variegata TaxID=167791 RepID=A0ACB9PFT1_BAUVA|nr:hypothetical protein L6164_008045 [Bauhinia variegata]